MITVMKNADGSFADVIGNPTLTRLDGEERAPLLTILHHSWSPEKRAGFGIYLATPFVCSEGKELRGNRRFEADEDGSVREVYDTADTSVNDVQTDSIVKPNERLSQLELAVTAMLDEIKQLKAML